MVDLVRTTTTAVERPDAVPTEAEARILVAWLRQSTAYAFRTGEALVYRLGPQARPRRLGRVPLLEPSVVGPITSGHASVAAMTLLGSVAPESSSVGLARGLAALLAEPPRLREAREALERAVHDPEATALAWRGLGWAQDRTGDPGKALASFRQAAALNPSDVDSRYGAGMILANAGWWDQAAIELAAALRLAPARDDIRAALAAVAARQR
jgi:tetratricopeptide (TPR) repeat protein